MKGRLVALVAALLATATAAVSPTSARYTTSPEGVWTGSPRRERRGLFYSLHAVGEHLSRR